jgi:CHASE3 domain sensor protein
MSLFNSHKTAKRIIKSFILIFALMLLMGAVGSVGINNLTSSFRKMYQRRLVPAMDISHIIEKQYQNRFHLEEHISGISIENYAQLENDIKINNRQVDSIISHYADGADILDHEEAKELKQYRNAIRSYRSLEKNILLLSRDNKKKEATQLFTANSYTAFQAAVRPMERLEDKQVALGKQLYQEAEKVGDNIRMALYASIAIALVVAITLAVIVSREYMI